MLQSSTNSWFDGTCAYGWSTCTDGYQYICPGQALEKNINVDKGDTIETSCHYWFPPTKTMFVEVIGPDGTSYCFNSCWNSIEAWKTGKYHIVYYPGACDFWKACVSIYYNPPRCFRYPYPPLPY